MPHSVNNSTSTGAKMSRPSSTSTYSASNVNANQFPKQAGATTLLAPETNDTQALTSPSQLSFTSSPRSVIDAPTFDDSRLRPATSAGANIARPYSRQRAQYYEEQFSYKDGTTSNARDRVTKDAPIVAELRTNVIIKDEYTLVTDLSHHLSTRYQKPETSIMITVNHSACLLLGGSFEPTYILTINALPVQLQPTLNKRNAAMIQNFMTESIGVPIDRGIVKFVAIQEEAFAMNGVTILGEIENLERTQAEETGMRRNMTKSSRRSGVSKAKSSITLSRKTSKANTKGRTVTPPLPSPGPLDSGIAVNEKGLQENSSTQPASKGINHKQSEPIMSRFSRRPSTNLVPPPIPESKTAKHSMPKRKSLLNIFRR
ncbi:Tautomerase/MIF [Didymella exigua CBS 183.55]|uniref:L-dopachrome isomerase n=1 Tax=Didymella exigua CBS 183.55 TaxID=1150837 RepID=A0A6A5RJ13_9PLEO|nr:Tautomerase/MIF [Didymella exigua CBS 183.55]KAF1927240.1 Tautomerase/MIF [Didymella exigua CBS 183.55]